MEQSQGNTSIFQTLYILWGAMLASHLMYVVVTLFIKAPEGFDASSNPVMPLLIGFLGFGVIEGIATLFARGFIVKQQTVDDKSRKQVMSAYQTGSIVSWALANSISIYGLVLYMMSYDHLLMVPFILLGVSLSVVTLPRKGEVEKYLSPDELPQDEPNGPSW